MHYILKDTVFENFLKVLNQIKRIHTKNVDSIKQFLNAVLYLCKAGCAWRLLPQEYGNWRSIHKRFKDWAFKGIWELIFELAKHDSDMEFVMIDSTIIRAHVSAAGYKKNSMDEQCLGRSRGGFSSKIHALTDASGKPLHFILTPGQRNDITQATLLTQEIVNAPVIADRGYDSTKFVKYLESKNCKVVIPPRKNRLILREYDQTLYKQRNRIERFFGKIKNMRRIATRYEKSAHSFLGFLYFLGSVIWFN
jgi:transposase